MTKIGRKSAGLLLLLTGGALIVHQVTEFSFWHVFGYVWPIVAASLILEVIYFYRNRVDGEKLVFNKAALGLIIPLLLISAFLQSFSASNFAAGQSGSWMAWITTGTTVPIEETYELENSISHIYLEVPNAKFSIEGTDADELIIEGTVKSHESRERDVLATYEKLRKTETGNGIFSYEIGSLSPSFFFSGRHFSADLSISVPEDMDVTVKAVNGGIYVKNLNENVNAATTNGEINVSAVTGDVKAKNTNGRIILKGITGNAEAVTTNGSVTAENAGGDLKLKTVNGTVKAEADDITGEWDLSAVNGDITLSFPESADASVDARTTNGKLTGDALWQMTGKAAGQSVTGDGTHTVHVRGTNGSINVLYSE